MKKARIAKTYRELAMKLTKELDIDTAWEKATIQAKFYHKTKRGRDDINYMAMLKPAYDGIVEAGMLVDDSYEHLTTLPAEFYIDKEFPRVSLLLERIK